MAEVIVSPLIKFVIENLTSQLKGEARLLTGVDEEIDRLSNSLGRIQAILIDAEKRQVTQESVRRWLRELKDVAYDADDITDEFATKILRSKAMDDDTSFLRSQVRSSFCFPYLCFRQILFRHKMGSRIKEVRKKIDEIETYGSRFNLINGVGEQNIESVKRPQTDSVLTEPKVYGRDEDRSNIVETLLTGGRSLEEDLSVIPIVGMGGLGKTTLAQSAYNDVRVTKHFELQIWVCVSDDFDVARLIKEIIESVTKTPCNFEGMDRLQSCLRDEVKGRRFLLVLDDVWKEAHEMRDKWNRMKTYLGCGAKGSKIIITTRFEEVAMVMGTTNPCYLKGLSEDDCWLLFEQWAFGEGRGEEHPNLVAIGREIVKMCGGVPLAAKALGSMMWLKREENEWLSVRDSEIWKLPEDQNGILPALRLSYNHLPSYLKQCFAYCSLYPKDTVIVKKTLIQQWIAEGFIHSSGGSKEMEDIGNEYFIDLLWRSFFQDVQKDGFGNITKCKMHDLIHDLAQSVSRDECCNMEVGKERTTLLRARHLSMFCEVSKTTVLKLSLNDAKNLRTLMILNYMELPAAFLDQTFSSLRYLRVLVLNFHSIKELPNSIRNLIHLRYLDLSNTGIVTLPNSISSLQSLQTLKLGSDIKELPQDVCNLTNLRHLDIRWCQLLTHIPAKIGQLSFLQTLPRFIVGKESRCGIGELHSLNLGGCIKIDNLENVSHIVDAKHAKLKEKKNLESLGLFWSKDESVNGYAKKIENVEQVLESFQPHPNLKKLWVINYSCVSFSRWLMDSLLPNLVEIKLRNCQRCELLPPLGQLPSLKVLVLQEMKSIKHLSREFYGNGTIKVFPSLKKLILRNMSNLEDWSQTSGEALLPCLEDLCIESCPILTSLPMLPSIRYLELQNTNTMILKLVAGLTSLSVLVITRFSELEILPKGMLQNHTLLRTLEIENCKKLRSLSRELENLTSLENLSIIGCMKLECFPKGLQNLISLKFLQMHNCPSLLSFLEDGMQGLTSLEEMTIQECGKLTSLPQGMKYLTSLHTLIINSLPELVSLPEGLQYVTTLRSLKIGGCDQFTSFPEWLGKLTSLRELLIQNFQHVKSLPIGLYHLSSLERLKIYYCPGLEERYGKNTGEDWQKIAHIPFVDISSSQESIGWRGFSHLRWGYFDFFQRI